MTKILSEDDIEIGLINFLVGTWHNHRICACPGGDILGYKERLDDGTGRDNKKQVVLPKVLRQKLVDLNPQIPTDTIDKVVADVLEYHGGDGTSLTLNKRLYNSLRDGLVVEFEKNGVPESDTLKFFDFDDLKKMKDEEKRAERENMTDQQLEIYDILCLGKKLTQAQEKTAKLAAVGLVQALTDHKSVREQTEKKGENKL